MDADIGEALRGQVASAFAAATPLRIVGGDTKHFYGRDVRGELLSVAGHRGIVNYHPAELVMTARAGTPLSDIEMTLADRRQMLPFEPPHFGERATLGGAIACGFSGPRRPYAGAARDFVLGVTMINGRGERLRFGGEVMKNVAGFDVARLMTGSQGTLGVLLEISLKVLPRPPQEMTLVQEWDVDDAIAEMNRWAGRPMPLSGSCYDGHRLYLRLSGTETAVGAAAKLIGGQPLAEGTHFWENVREHRHAYFGGGAPLWRLSLPPMTPSLALPGKWLVEWGGAQRWLRGEPDETAVRSAAQEAGGHATLFRGGERGAERFHPLPPVLQGLHRRIKQAFDPKGILNRGRIYEWC